MDAESCGRMPDTWHAALFVHSPVAHLLIDGASGRIVDANGAALRLAGCSAEALAGTTLAQFAAGAGLPAAAMRTWRSAGLPDGALLAALDGGMAAADTVARYRRLAYFDPVTDLPNRNLFDEQFRTRLAQPTDERHPLSLLIVNLVNFKEVNYALGHHDGDALLRLVGLRIQALLGPGDLVARVGSRFPVLLANAAADAALEMAGEIQQVLESPFHVGGIACELSAHIGISCAPLHGDDYPGLLRKADISLYQAARHDQSLAVYSPSFDPHTPERLALIGELRGAIAHGELRVFCQPKIDMRTRQVAGAEALVRWIRPGRGAVAPDAFVPLIESTDLIHVLTRHMLGAAAARSRAWRRAGMHVPLAVNLSARDLAAMRLSETLPALLGDAGGGAADLELEVTESSLMRDPAHSIAELERLSGLGFRLYVDDFGTGYSSLGYLARLPVDVIKIDHGFTMRMVDDTRAAAIVRSTIHLAHDLGMGVVAEGTADRPIWDALAKLGCDEAQGYYIAQPFPAEQFGDWLRASPYALAAH